MPAQEITDRLIEIAEPVCEAAGYELVELQYLRGPRGWVVRVFIDFADELPDGAHVSFSDCERVSRELSAVFDVEDPIPQAYSLEVSSPGVERPLRTAEHFRRYVGEQARIRLRTPLEGRRNFEGRLVDADGEAIRIDIDGTTHLLPIGQVASANLVPDWNELMAGKRQGT